MTSSSTSPVPTIEPEYATTINVLVNDVLMGVADVPEYVRELSIKRRPFAWSMLVILGDTDPEGSVTSIRASYAQGQDGIKICHYRDSYRDRGNQFTGDLFGHTMYQDYLSARWAMAVMLMDSLFACDSDYHGMNEGDFTDCAVEADKFGIFNARSDRYSMAWTSTSKNRDDSLAHVTNAIATFPHANGMVILTLEGGILAVQHFQNDEVEDIEEAIRYSINTMAGLDLD